MSADRELLELAAKAVGIKIDKSPYNGGGRGSTGFDILGSAVLDWHNNITWNPLTNDGDALRLAVKLGLQIGIDIGSVGAVTVFNGNCSVSVVERIGNDSGAATRRAIVRAAAEIADRGAL